MTRYQSYCENKQLVEVVQAKRCRDCLKIKPLDLFNLSRRSWSGRTTRCKDCRSLFHKEYWLRRRKTVLARRYKVTPKYIEDLQNTQNNCCAICKLPLDFGRLTHFDHNHKTGQLRGILCAFCNHGIGSLRENPQLLLNAIEYLAKYQ